MPHRPLFMSEMHDFWVVIPARRASSRLPDKPLADIHGKPMVVRVAERAALSKAKRIIVATDDRAIEKACGQHGIDCVMTRKDHQSGTDRIGEAASALGAGPAQIIVNVQGDEPLIEPEVIDQVARALQDNARASVATACAPINDRQSLINPNVVKVVSNERDEAMYFSRAPIPYHRNQWPSLSEISSADPPAARHIGIYAFRSAALAQFSAWPVCEPERIEQLEQLRWLWNGHVIAVCMLQRTPNPGVDTPEDLERVRTLWLTLGSL